MKKPFRQAVLLGVLVLSFGVRVPAQQAGGDAPPELINYPDLIVYNAKIVTMDDASLNDSPGNTVEAMAVRGDRIQFLGSNQQLLRYAGPQTRKIDLKGRTIVPGMIDTHNHLHNAAVSRWAKKNPAKLESVARQFSVTGKTFAELTKGIEVIVKENMARPLPGQWAMITVPSTITGLGVGANYVLGSTANRVAAQKKGAPGAMSRGDLDRLAPKLPVLIYAHGGSWLLNTAGRDDFLRLYAIEPTDENEELAITSGSLFGRALLAEKYFRHHGNELAAAVQEYLQNWSAGGFTTYSSHLQGISFMPAFQKLVREDRMPIRLGFAHRFCQEIEPDQPGCFLRLGDWAGMGGKYFWNVGVTLGAIDGSGARACTSMEPLPEYRKPGSNWLLQDCRLRPESPYWKAIYTALQARYRYVVNHAFGDKSMSYFLDIVEKVMKDNPDITLDFIRSLRLTADHCTYFPTPDQLPRMKKLGMMFSCGSDKINQVPAMMKVFGQEKGDWVVPVKSALQAGVMVSAEGEGSGLAEDSPATPMIDLYRFVTRKTARGQVIGPNQALDRVSALKMSTVWASYYVIREKELGTLEPGKLADFVVFNKDFFTVPEEEIPTVFPLMTVLGGETVMLREELAKELGLAAVGPQKKFKFVEDPSEAAEAPRDGG